MDTIKFRKHPGHAGGFIRSFQILLFLSLIGHLVGLVISLFFMFMQKIKIEVITAKVTLPDIKGDSFYFDRIKEMRTLTFDHRNALEWLFLPRGPVDFFSLLVSSIVVYYAYRVFREINFIQPFYEDISKWLVKLYQTMFFGYVFIVIRSLYIKSVVSDLVGKGYKINNDVSMGYGYISIGTIVIVYIIVHVYKKGIALQQEQNLVI